MKVVAILSFNAPIEISKRILLKIGKKAAERTGGFQNVALEKDSNDYIQLKRLLKENIIDYSEWFRNIFSKEEIVNTEFCRMLPGLYWSYPQPESRFKYKSVTYDKKTGCQKCGNGMIQDRPFYISTIPKEGKYDIFAINWEYEYIISDRIRGMIEAEKLTGCSFLPVLTRKTKQPILGYNQLHIDNVLPPMSENTVFEIIKDIRKCTCTYKGRMLKPLYQIIYTRAALKYAKDFNKSTEWLGGGEKTTQEVIVSRRVCELFLAENFNAVPIFEPIMIEE